MPTFSGVVGDVLCRNGRPSFNGIGTGSNDVPNGAGTLDLVYRVHGQKGVGGRVGIFMATGASATDANKKAGTDWVLIGDTTLNGGTNSDGQQMKRVTIPTAVATALAADSSAFFKVRLEPRDGTEYHWGFTFSYPF